MWFLDLLIALSGKREAKHLLQTFKKWQKGKKVSEKDKGVFSQVKKMFESKTKVNPVEYIYGSIKRQFGAKQKAKWRYDNRLYYALKGKGKKPTAQEQEHDETFSEWDNAVLSSSWLVAGSYSKSRHSLEITTIKGKSYVYPAVPIDVWAAMKAAKGKNGTGAGSAFWHMFLIPKGWIQSGVRCYIKENVHPALWNKYKDRTKQRELSTGLTRKYRSQYLAKQRYQKAKQKKQGTMK